MSNQSDAKETLVGLAGRLPEIDEHASPLWGKMRPQEMVEHLVQSMRISNGRAEVPLMVPERQALVGRRFMLGDRPLPREFANPLLGPTAPPLEFAGIATAREALLEEIERFFAYHSTQSTSAPIHPVFGPMTGAEWEQFHVKHFVHHLGQFGVGAGEA